MEGVVSFAIPAGPTGGSHTFPLVITIPAPSPLPPAGTYASTFTGTDFQVYWNTASQSTCAALTGAGSTRTSSGTFSASAVVVNQCGVSATNMNFGSASLLNAALTATAQVSVSCNAAIPLTVALDNGATGTSPTNRLMTAGSQSIQYGIYKDSAHSQAWGNTAGVNTVPDELKFACVQIIKNAQATPGLNVKSGKLDGMRLDYFSSALVDESVSKLLAPYVSQRMS